MAVGVAGRIEHRQSQLADLDGRSFFELVVDRERLEVVIERVDPSLLRNVDAHGFLVSMAKAVGDDSGHMDRRLAEQLAEASGAPCMIAMTMREDEMADACGIESILLDIGDDRLGPHPCADVDQRLVDHAEREPDVLAARSVGVEERAGDDRDAVLGRESTAEEIEYLATGGRGF